MVMVVLALIGKRTNLPHLLLRFIKVVLENNCTNCKCACNNKQCLIRCTCKDNCILHSLTHQILRIRTTRVLLKLMQMKRLKLNTVL